MIMEMQFSVWTSFLVFMYAAKRYTTIWFLRTQSITVNSKSSCYLRLEHTHTHTHTHTPTHTHLHDHRYHTMKHRFELENHSFEDILYRIKKLIKA